MNNNEPIWLQHQFFMAKAIELAEQAYKVDEVPVGAVVVKENKVIGKGYNQTELLGDATAHAEMIALSAAYETSGSKYLHGATLYVSLEPCVMCAGALIWSKIDRLVLGRLIQNQVPAVAFLTSIITHYSIIDLRSFKVFWRRMRKTY